MLRLSLSELQAVIIMTLYQYETGDLARLFHLYHIVARTGHDMATCIQSELSGAKISMVVSRKTW